MEENETSSHTQNAEILELENQPQKSPSVDLEHAKLTQIIQLSEIHGRENKSRNTHLKSVMKFDIRI